MKANCIWWVELSHFKTAWIQIILQCNFGYILLKNTLEISRQKTDISNETVTTFPEWKFRVTNLRPNYNFRQLSIICAIIAFIRSFAVFKWSSLAFGSFNCDIIFFYQIEENNRIDRNIILNTLSLTWMRDDFEMMEMTNHILLLFIIIIYTHSNDVLMKHLIMCILCCCVSAWRVKSKKVYLCSEMPKKLEKFTKQTFKNYNTHGRMNEVVFTSIANHSRSFACFLNFNMQKDTQIHFLFRFVFPN